MLVHFMQFMKFASLILLYLYITVKLLRKNFYGIKRYKNKRDLIDFKFLNGLTPTFTSEGRLNYTRC